MRHRAAGIFGYLTPMQGARPTTTDSAIAKGSWSEIFRNGLGLYSSLVIGGIAMNATQMLVIAIIMPNDQTVDFDWTKYRVSASAVEQLTGYKFFRNVPEEIAAALREHVDDVEVRVPRTRRPGN